MIAEVVSSSQGPVVLYEGLILHLDDVEGLMLAVDSTAFLLQNLEKAILDHFVVTSEFVKESFIEKKYMHVKLVSNALTAMDNFGKFAHVEYINYLHNKTAQNNPQMTREQIQKETRRQNREDINDFYAEKPQ